MTNTQASGLPKHTKICYGFGEVGRGISITLQTTFLLYYLVNFAGIPAATVGTMVLVARVWDAINDPLMGLLVDNTNLKRGKARPYLLYCAIPAGLFLALLFAIPATLPTTAKVVWAYVAYLGTGMLFTSLDVPYNTLMVTLTNKPRDRVSLTTSKYVIGTLGTLLPAGLIPILADTADDPGGMYTLLAAVFAAVGAGCYLIVYFTSREQNLQARQKLGLKQGLRVLVRNKPWLQVSLLYFLYSTCYAIITGALLFYATSFLRAPGLVTPILLMIMAVLAIGSALAGPLVAKFGKRNVVAGGLVLAILSLVLRLVTRDGNIALTIVCLCTQFLGMGYCAVLGNPMISDTVAWGEYKFGTRVESLSFSSVTFGNKLGLGIGAALLSYMLAYTGYVENSAEQSERVLGALFAAEVTIPLVLVVLLLGVALTYRLDKRLPEVTEALAQKQGKEVEA